MTGVVRGPTPDPQSRSPTLPAMLRLNPQTPHFLCFEPWLLRHVAGAVQLITGWTQSRKWLGAAIRSSCRVKACCESRRYVKRWGEVSFLVVCCAWKYLTVRLHNNMLRRLDFRKTTERAKFAIRLPAEASPRSSEQRVRRPWEGVVFNLSPHASRASLGARRGRWAPLVLFELCCFGH